MHTHDHVDSQFGELMLLIWATAKPGEKTKNASGVARSVILCPAALRVVGLKGTKESIDGRVRRSLLIRESSLVGHLSPLWTLNFAP